MSNQPLRGSKESQLKAIASTLKLVLKSRNEIELHEGVKSVIKWIERELKSKRKPAPKSMIDSGNAGGA
jgi:hypothetical protein